LLLAVEGIESVVNSPEVKGSVQALDKTLKGLEKLVENVDGKVGSLASNIDGTVKDARKIVKNADGQITEILSGVDETVKDTHKLVKNADTRVESVTAAIEKTTEEARSAIEQGERTLSSTGDVIAKDSPMIYKLTETLEELKAAAQSLRSMADYLERHPDALLRGKGGSGGN
jgi:paraquat-inducible protein B